MERPLAIPVLTYHSVNVIENTYDQNDHLALAADLRYLAASGWNIVSLEKVVDWHQGELPVQESEVLENTRAIALTFDDGSCFDYYDLEHPTCGLQRSFFNILHDFQAEQGEQAGSRLHATSFVICSPVARDELDRKGLIGKGWWTDEWWRPAQESGLFSIESHSWDHDHPDLDHVAQQDQLKGDFRNINTYADCDIQVAKSGEYIERQLNGVRPTLFAYPWGQASEYLVRDYFPGYRDRHRFRAAFTTEPKPVSKADSIWALPRFVFGRDWKSPAQLAELLVNCR